MKKEFKIGLAGIAALVILFCGIHYLKGINMFKPESYYLVEFENVNGLPESSPVFANGFKVGIVRDLRYNYQKPGHVLVGVELDQHMKVPKGSRAELVTEMLGTVKMNLLLNLESAEYYGENDTIPGFANNGIMGAAEKDLLPHPFRCRTSQISESGFPPDWNCRDSYPLQSSAKDPLHRTDPAAACSDSWRTDAHKDSGKSQTKRKCHFSSSYR